jgi:hypothetical protein
LIAPQLTLITPGNSLTRAFTFSGRGSGPLLEEVPSCLSKYIAQRYPAELSPEQTKQVILHLESRCSDVTYAML